MPEIHRLLQTEGMAQIYIAHRLVGQYGFGVTLGDDVAVIDYVGLVADIQRLAHVMVGDQHTDALVLEMLDDLLDIVHRYRVHPGKGLVQQDELRICGQRPGNLGPSTLATGQAHPQAVTQMADMEFTQQRIQLALAAVMVEVLARLQDGHDVGGDAELADDRGFLRQAAGAAAFPLGHGEMGDILAVDQGVAAVGPDEADDHVEAGSLAGAVGTEQTDHLAAVDLQRDILDHAAGLVGLGQMAGFKFRRHCSPARYVYGAESQSRYVRPNHLPRRWRARRPRPDAGCRSWPPAPGRWCRPARGTPPGSASPARCRHGTGWSGRGHPPPCRRRGSGGRLPGSLG